MSESTCPRFRDADGYVWEDREGYPMLVTPNGPAPTDFCTMQGVRHAYGPLEPVSGTAQPATDSDKVLRIVADWVDTAARTAVTDIDDLIWDLKQAGYTLPNPTEHPKEN